MPQAYDIPNGPKNLATIFPGVDFTQVAEYYITGTGFSTTINVLDGECCEDKYRIHFQNYLGRIDAINFKLLKEQQEVKSDTFTRPTDLVLVRPKHGSNKIGVHAGDVFWLTTSDYDESAKEWLKELLSSPKVWIEELENVDGDTPSYIPVIIIDDTFEVVFEEDRFLYSFNIKVKLSHEKIIIRN